jgi:protein involved in polysaccharide export with SLBB domain
MRIMNFKNLIFGLFTLFCALGTVSAQIQAGKAINITISNVPDQDKSTINNTYPVSDSGMINMPFIGQVRAGGLRNEELAANLQSRYKDAGIYTNPTIQILTTRENVNVAEEIVTVGGQVRKPGPVAFVKGLTLWQAVQSAGGPTDFGSMRRVTLFRDGKQKEYDLKNPEMMRIPLQRNDTIDIPQKTILNR